MSEELKRSIRRIFNNRLTTQINFKVIVPKSQQHYRTIVAPYNPTAEKIEKLINQQINKVLDEVKEKALSQAGFGSYVPLMQIEEIQERYKS